MQVSTKLYNEQSLARFSELNGQIQEAQAKIATGKKILRASDDPVAAVKLSVAEEQVQLVDRFQTNIERARSRLQLTENAMEQGIAMVTRIQELAIQARNDTFNAIDRQTMHIEISQLKKALMALANSRDSQGQALFSGFYQTSDAFIFGDDGMVQYKGDRGVNSVRVSETMMLQTGLDGATAFLRVPVEGGGHDSLFAIIETIETHIASGEFPDDASENLYHAIEHMSLQQAFVGAQMSKADLQADALAERKLIVESAASVLGDADIAALVTQMQALLVSRDAAQQAFAKIGQQSLFDFIR